MRCLEITQLPAQHLEIGLHYQNAGVSAMIRQSNYGSVESRFCKVLKIPTIVECFQLPRAKNVY